VIIAALLLSAWVSGPTPLPAAVIGFDDLPVNPTELPIANGYAGLNWTNFSYLNAVTFFSPNSGYPHGLVSAPNVAFNLAARTADISSATPFTFNGAYLIGAWNNGLQVEVQGFQGASKVYDTTVTAAPVSGPPQFFTFDFVGVTRLHFVPSGGVLQTGLSGSGENFGMDNLTISAVPEPSTFILLSLGVVAMAYSFWRRKPIRWSRPFPEVLIARSGI
jgi:hypothetical protein